MKKWFERYAYAGCLPTDSPQKRLQKAIMVISPSLLSFFCIFWVAGYYLLGKPVSASIPGGYALFSMASILLFFKTKHYAFFRFSQILFILCLPFLLQTSLGGFRSGSGVQMWAMLSPVAALMFQSTRAAAYWFACFVILTIICGFAEPYLSTHITPLPDLAITAFFTLNFICAFFLLYISVNYYVVENKRIVAIVEKQKDKLMAADKIKNNFFANLSHEFRTPLALTIGPLEDALSGQHGIINDNLRLQLEVMLRNSRRLLRLINQLLDISKIEADEMKLDLQRHDLRYLTKNLVQNFSPYAERKQIEFEFDAEDGPINLNFDSERIEKVINNLLSNAIKFTPDKGRVKLQLNHDSHGAYIKVRDSGPGIDTKDIDKIFDRFYQVDGSSTREHEGTGIGLSLVKELVELHGGSITVKSEIGFGSEFTVFIPGEIDHLNIEKSALPQFSSSIEISSLPVKNNTDLQVADANSTKRATVLIVDDNNDIRDYLYNCLTPHYHVIQAANGEQGIKQAQQHKPDLVISDIMMPGIDGYQLCRTLKEDTSLDHIPVMFLTAKASEDMKVEGLDTGADDYLVKPFNSKELLARTRNLVTLRKQKKELKRLNQKLEKRLEQQLLELSKSNRLGSYFSDKILHHILSEDEATELATERRNITIFFSDLCNFTDMTDRIEPEKAATLINEYLSEVAMLVEQHGGTLVQIIGDAIMAFFGAPEPMSNEDQAIKALQLGIAIQIKVQELSKDWLTRGLEYEANARIGIHQDYVTVGNFGSDQLMEYTAIGKGVNLAARLETSCTPGNIKVSHPVYLMTCENFNYGPVSEEEFKGFSRKLKVCELNPSDTNIRTT